MIQVKICFKLLYLVYTTDWIREKIKICKINLEKICDFEIT